MVLKHIQLLFICLAMLLVAGCQKKTELSDKAPEINRELAIQKTNSANQLFQRYLLLHGSDSIAYQALDSLNMAIQNDSTYSLAYQHKSNILAHLDSLNAAIEVIEAFLDINPEDDMAMTQKGFLYERLSKQSKNKAKEAFENAIAIYDEKLKEEPDNVWLWSERAWLFVFTDSKEKALEEIGKVIEKFPDDETARLYKEEIVNFDRDEFINSMY